MALGLVVVDTVHDERRRESADPLDLRRRRRLRDDDRRVETQPLRGPRDREPVVPGRGGHDLRAGLERRQRGERPAHLERAGGLQRLELERESVAFDDRRRPQVRPDPLSCSKHIVPDGCLNRAHPGIFVAARHPLRSWSVEVDIVNVIGSGRVGSAVAARLRERGVDVRADEAELVVLCVPDSVIAEVAGSIAPGPWIAHVSGATPLEALDPHVRRFSVHPLQTFTRARGAEQLDGAWAAVTAESEEARARGTGLAQLLGLHPFDLRDEARTLYHAGAVFCSNYIVTLHRAATLLFEAAGAPPEALEPLMRHTIENGFELTGPISRGDWATVDAHKAAIHEARAELDQLYDTLAGATLALAT